MAVSAYFECEAFDPERVKAIGAAYDSLCREMGLLPAKWNLATLRVAEVVIEAAKVEDGCDPEAFVARARQLLASY
jgi:hypothetical protein